jgi:hypothetical protein
MRTARWTSTPKYVPPASVGRPVWMPMRARISEPERSCWTATAAATADAGSVKTAKTSSARQSTSCPLLETTAFRTTSR